jgi:hypothetical protein
VGSTAEQSIQGGALSCIEQWGISISLTSGGSGHIIFGGAEKVVRGKPLAKMLREMKAGVHAIRQRGQGRGTLWVWVHCRQGQAILRLHIRRQAIYKHRYKELSYLGQGLQMRRQGLGVQVWGSFLLAFLICGLTFLSLCSVVEHYASQLVLRALIGTCES